MLVIDHDRCRTTARTETGSLTKESLGQAVTTLTIPSSGPARLFDSLDQISQPLVLPEEVEQSRIFTAKHIVIKTTPLPPIFIAT